VKLSFSRAALNLQSLLRALNAATIAKTKVPRGWRRALSAGQDELEQIRERLAVLRAQSGDRAAFGQLVTRYQERLMYYVHHLIDDREASRDVLQEIWLDVFRKLGQLRVP
jgi:hypothetical protein